MGTDIKNTILGFAIIGVVIILFTDAFGIGSWSLYIGLIVVGLIIFGMMHTHRFLKKLADVLSYYSYWNYNVVKEYRLYLDEIYLQHEDFASYRIKFDNVNDFMITFTLPVDLEYQNFKVSKKEEDNIDYEEISESDTSTDKARLIRYYKVNKPNHLTESMATFILSLFSFPFIEKIMINEQKVEIEVDLPLSIKSNALMALAKTLEEFIIFLDEEFQTLLADSEEA